MKCTNQNRKTRHVMPSGCDDDKLMSHVRERERESTHCSLVFTGRREREGEQYYLHHKLTSLFSASAQTRDKRHTSPPDSLKVSICSSILVWSPSNYCFSFKIFSISVRPPTYLATRIVICASINSQHTHTHNVLPTVTPTVEKSHC